MTIEDLNGKRICMLGFGREGQAVLRAVEQYAPDASFCIGDGNPDVIAPESSLDISLQLGDDYLHGLDRFDVVIKSPGIPPKPEFEPLGDKLTNSTQVFIDTALAKGAQVIGITGTKGKSTTTKLLYEILKAGDTDAYLVGNIGIPAIDFIEHAKPEAVFVLEMSSYQLHDVRTSPPIAVILNIFPEHLTWHGSLEAYEAAKGNICAYQNEGDNVYFCDDNEAAAALAMESVGQKIPFTKADCPIAIADTKLLGDHNLHNIAAAYCVARDLGVSDSIALEAIKNFEGLEHRLQLVGTYHGVTWVNDAISTTPESAIAALNALGDKVRCIILGGEDRGLDFTDLGPAVAGSSLEHVILWPDTGARIKESIEAAGAGVAFFECDSMEAAIEYAKTATYSVDDPICLLSTASPSYNMFKDFEEKGELFMQTVGG